MCACDRLCGVGDRHGRTGSSCFGKVAPGLSGRVGRSRNILRLGRVGFLAEVGSGFAVLEGEMRGGGGGGGVVRVRNCVLSALILRYSW